MRDAAGNPVTAHSLNPVPLLVAGPRVRGPRRSRDGVLADVAPTILELAGLPRWDGDDRALAAGSPSAAVGRGLLLPSGTVTTRRSAHP